MSLLQKIRQRVRLQTHALDGELADLIAECKADMALSGVLETKIIDTDPLILRAISTYCLAHYETDNVKAERLQAAYGMIKSHLSLSGDYGRGPL